MSRATKPKRGRPSLGLEEMVRVPATPELKALMEAAAQRAGVTAAEAWRRAALTWLAGSSAERRDRILATVAEAADRASRTANR